MKSSRQCIRTSVTTRDFSFSIENRYASGVIKRPRGPRPGPTPSLSFDLQTRALCYYLNYQLQTPSDVGKLLGSVQDSVSQWASGTKYSIIDLAITAMSLAVFSRTQKHPAAAVEAAAKYDRLLREARVAIPELVQSDVDAALLATFLMGRYEDSVHLAGPLVPGMAFRSYMHHEGSKAILKIWEERCQTSSQPASAIIKYSRRGIIRSALLRHLAVPASLEDGGRFGEFGLELEYDRLLIGVASIRNRLKCLQQEVFLSQSSKEEVVALTQELYVEAAALDAAFQVWTRRVPISWCPQRHLLTERYSLPRQHFLLPVVYSYQCIAYAAIWLNYFATRMLLNRARLKILYLRRALNGLADQQPQEEQCCSEMRLMADALSASVPFVLDRFQVSGSPTQTALAMTSGGEIKPYAASLVACKFPPPPKDRVTVDMIIWNPSVKNDIC